LPDNAEIVLENVRSTDRDRYLTTLYAPESKRPALLALYAFNAEIASVRDRIREALPGEVRLQWWRDVIEAGANDDASGHPVAEQLLAAIREYSLPKQAFLDYLEARIFDLYDDPMPARTDLEGYCGETAGAIIQLSALMLDPAAAAGSAEAAGHAGCAQAMTGILTLLPIHRARGQCFIPRDLLAAAGTTLEEFLTSGDSPSALGAVSAMTALAREHLVAFESRAGQLPESLRPAFLPLSLTKAVLTRVEKHPRDLLLGKLGQVSQWRKQWLLFRRATRGWAA
jgi:phytoene synthase